jgi:hypothetical protein
MTWMIGAAPAACMSWAFGKFEAARHGYVSRGLPNMAQFAAHKPLGPGLAAGLAIAFWLALLFFAARSFAGNPRRTRRSLMILIGFALVAFSIFIARRLPEWRALATGAAYGGQQVNLVLGVILLALMTIVQASLRQQLSFVAAVGLAAAVFSYPAVRLEKKLFKSEPAALKERRWPDRIGPVAIAINLLVFAAFLIAPQKPASPGHPNVFWISIDTLRADHLSFYGYKRPTCPNLAALAADGVVVDEFVAQSPWTLPSHATMFSGVGPLKHGVTTQANQFSPHTQLFPEILKERGYRNGAIVTSLLLAPTFGYSAGFDKYEMNIEYNAETVVSQGLRWLTQSSVPTFLFLHIFEPHFPYSAPRPFLGKFGKVDPVTMDRQKLNFFDFVKYVKNGKSLLKEVIDRYDEEIFFADNELGRFFTELKKRGLYDDSWIIVVSDHGEEFFEHGFMGHSVTLYEEMLRVPMIVKAPRGRCAGTRFSAGQIPQSAVAELILSAANPPGGPDDASACDQSDGSLAVLHRLASDAPIIASSSVFGPDRFAARRPGMKLHSPATIEKGDTTLAHGFELFDLTSDPAEKNNIYEKGAAPDLEKTVADAYTELAGKTVPGERHRLDPETIRQLKSLGYIQ